MSRDEQFDTVVVGGGQAGLACAYCLAQMREEFVVLEAGPRVGQAWRERWDSLRLFTPARYSALPGMPFPAPDSYFPTKDEVADYLEAYAQHYQFPIRFNLPVTALRRDGEGYLLRAGSPSISARQVIVATGAFRNPYVPPFAGELDPSIVQLHSAAYRNPAQVPQGPVLVVGAANSGAEIALELSRAGRKVWLSGRDVGRIPADRLGRVLGGRPYWWLISRVLSVATPVGRKVRQQALHHGNPLIRIEPRDFELAGVARLARIAGASGGQPRLDDGQVLDVAAVVWATGFRPDFSWIDLPIFDGQGNPLHDRGVVTQAPGLYFSGLHFQSALTSALIGGTGADARYLAKAIRVRKAVQPEAQPAGAGLPRRA
jgi:putative flavoprotein involved in K+ transport